jgi:hypothetical protein
MLIIICTQVSLQRHKYQTVMDTNSIRYMAARSILLVFLRWVHTIHAFRNAATLQVTHTIRSYDLNFHPVLVGVTVSCKRYTRQFPVCYGCSRQWWRVTFHVHTCSCCNVIIPLVRRPNTDSASNMPVTLQRKLLIRCVVTSPVHTVTIRCCGTRKRYKCVPSLTLCRLMTYICCTAPLTPTRCILNIYSTNIHTEYFKRAA